MLILLKKQMDKQNKELLRSLSYHLLLGMIYLPKTVISTSHQVSITMKSSLAKILRPSQSVRRERQDLREPLLGQDSMKFLVQMNILGINLQTSIWDLHLKDLIHLPRLVPVLMLLLDNTMMASDSTRIQNHLQSEKRGLRR